MCSCCPGEEFPSPPSVRRDRRPCSPHFPWPALLVPWSRLSRRRLAVNIALLAGGLLAVFVVSGTSSWLYGRTWLSVRSLGPLAVLAGAFLLARADASRPQYGVLRQRQALVLWMLALLSLLQFPFAAPIYYCYVAPIVVLAIAAIRPIHPTVPRSVTAIVVAFLHRVRRLARASRYRLQLWRLLRARSPDRAASPASRRPDGDA